MSKSSVDTEDLKILLDQMLKDTYRSQEDRSQVFKVELYVTSDEEDAALALKPLYMKTTESPYIFDYDEQMNKITLWYIPAMKIIYNIRKTLEEQPENNLGGA